MGLRDLVLKARESARSQAEPGKRCEVKGRILPLFVGGRKGGWIEASGLQLGKLGQELFYQSNFKQL